MNKARFILLLMLISTYFVSCKKNLTQPDPGGPGTPVEYTTKEIQVVFPSNTAIDPSSCTAMTFTTEFKIDAQGKTKVAVTDSTPTIAWVFDKSDQLMLAGFITDSSAVVNAASTAKVLLYFAYQVPLQPYNITEVFINRVEEIPGVTSWYDEFTTLFSANPLTIAQGSFAEPLKKKMEELTKSTKIDIHGKKAADISVNGDVRSGLQVSSDLLSKFKIIHTYRRRAHAFLYKKSYKDLNGKVENITNYDANGQDFIVNPVSAVNSLVGEAGKAIEGKLNESASVEFGPYDMELDDNESEANYILRIVGPGFGGTNAEPRTKRETDKLSRLELETFALDIMLPIIMEIAGNKEAIQQGGINMGDGPTEKFLEEAEIFIKAFPNVWEEIRKGDYYMAFREGVFALWSNTGQKYLKNLLIATVAIEYASAKKLSKNVPDVTFEQAEKMIKKPLAMLKAVDLILQGGDFVRIFANITSSRQMEEWELTARGANVTLLPEEKITIPYQQVKLTATIKNLKVPDDTHPFFEWKTSGKFGTITDTKGHTDLTSFNSEDKEIFYVSRSNNSSLSDGDNIDYIYVTAFLGNAKIGSDTVTINVKKDKYLIKPNGITVTGKDKASSELALYLEKANGYNGIEANDSIDYKVVWTISGKYGKLSGSEILYQNVITSYNENWIIYECMDADTKEGIENVTAKLYRKRKAESASEYRLFDEAEGIVKINNDEKKKILHVPIQCGHGDTLRNGGNSMTCMATSFASFAADKDAKSYRITFLSNWYPATYSWNAGSPQPSPVDNYVSPASPGIFKVAYGSTWTVGAPSQIKKHNTCTPGGMAEVVITLK